MLKKKLLRRIYELRRDKVKEREDNCIMRKFIIPRILLAKC
jgi:hypothetical protein